MCLTLGQDMLLCPSQGLTQAICLKGNTALGQHISRDTQKIMSLRFTWPQQLADSGSQRGKMRLAKLLMICHELAEGSFQHHPIVKSSQQQAHSRAPSEAVLRLMLEARPAWAWCAIGS